MLQPRINQHPHTDDYKTVELHISLLLGILSIYPFSSSLFHEKLGPIIFMSTSVILSGYTIYSLWKTVTTEKGLLKSYNVYSFINIDRSLSFTIVILYLITFSSAFIGLFFIFKNEPSLGLFSIFLCLLISVLNLVIILIIRYKKKSGIYGIAINTEEMRIATSEFCHLFLLSDVDNTHIDKKYLRIDIKDKALPSPIKIQLSMLAEDDKHELLNMLGGNNVILRTRKD